MKSRQFMLYASFASAVVADTLIAVSLCTLLIQSRTGFKKWVRLHDSNIPLCLTIKKIRTDSIVTKLMAFSINTGAFHIVVLLIKSSPKLTIKFLLGLLTRYGVFPRIEHKSHSQHVASRPSHVLWRCAERLICVGISSNSEYLWKQYAIWPQRFIFMGIYFALSKCKLRRSYSLFPIHAERLIAYPLSSSVCQFSTCISQRSKFVAKS